MDRQNYYGCYLSVTNTGNILRVFIPQVNKLIKTRIYDANGRSRGGGKSGKIDITDLKPSIYMAVVETNRGTCTKQFIKH